MYIYIFLKTFNGHNNVAFIKDRESIDEIHLGCFKTVALALTFMKFCLDVENSQ